TSRRWATNGPTKASEELEALSAHWLQQRNPNLKGATLIASLLTVTAKRAASQSHDADKMLPEEPAWLRHRSVRLPNGRLHLLIAVRPPVVGRCRAWEPRKN